jgi:hypothetical protein
VTGLPSELVKARVPRTSSKGVQNLDTSNQVRAIGRLRAFLAENPWWGFAGAVSGIIAIPLAIYLYIAGKEAPDLRFYVNPVRTVIAKAGINSDLTILFNKEPISDDVTSVSIAVWNAGTKPIMASDVLAPLQLVVEPGHGILEAKLVSATRKVVGLELDNSELRTGVVGLKFRILEHNDGGIVQFLYRGDSSVKIRMQGSTIGQSAPKASVYSANLQSLSDQVRNNRRSVWVMSVIAFLMITLSLAVMISGKKFHWGSSINAVLWLALAMYEWYTGVAPGPPFDFH